MPRTATETLNEARKLSPGIAGWIDGMRAKGKPDFDICAALKNAAELAKFEREAHKSGASS